MIRDRVSQILDRNGIRYAVIGAVAVAARGAARSTMDFDLLTTDRRVLQRTLWEELSGSGITLDIRKGDVDDPLSGVVRIGSATEQIDVVVGKWRWQQAVIERAEIVDIDGLYAPLATVSDLILLKLDAGGPIDQQDVIRLLAVGPREQLIAEVNEKIGDLPDDARALWQAILAKT